MKGCEHHWVVTRQFIRTVTRCTKCGEEKEVDSEIPVGPEERE
jgi:hypothetical protein